MTYSGLGREPDGISEGRRKMYHALSRAKTDLYEAHHQAKKETLDEMAERIWAVFNEAEQLFIDERKVQWGSHYAREAALDQEYGPRPAS